MPPKATIIHGRPLIYVAGPYTSSPAPNTHKAIRAGLDLWDRGYALLIPHAAALALDLVDPRPTEEWYEFDLHLLERCDAVLRLPGESVGADREIDYAKALGIPVFQASHTPRGLDLGGLDEWFDHD